MMVRTEIMFLTRNDLYTVLWPLHTMWEPSRSIGDGSASQAKRQRFIEGVCPELGLYTRPLFESREYELVSKALMRIR